jgi:hypothetical protein
MRRAASTSGLQFSISDLLVGLGATGVGFGRSVSVDGTMATNRVQAAIFQAGHRR